MPTNVDIRRIEQLLKETDWSVAKMAKELGITRQGLYDRLRRAHIVTKDRKRANASVKVDKQTLSRLYVDEQLSVTEIARRLSTRRDNVTQQLRAYNIPKIPREHPREYPGIASLNVGESIEIALRDKKMPTFNNLRGQAKKANIRIVIRRKDETTAILTRTPELTYQVIAGMRDAGMTHAAIAEVFLSSPRTISGFLDVRKKDGKPGLPPHKQTSKT